MNARSLIRVFYLVTVGLLLAACGAPATSQPSESDVPEADAVETRVAARVAEELSVAATLTAVAPPPTEAAALTPVEPTATALRPTSTPATPADTPVTTTETATPAPANTPVPVPTDTPLPPPEPTATPILIPVLPVDGGGDQSPNLRNNRPVMDGRNIAFPGFSQAQVSNPMIFRDWAVFQVEVFDANVGTKDGDGIQNVVFRITDSEGDQVHERTENHAGYCVFGGGEPDCNVWVFAEHGYKWPDGEPITNGTHNVRATINAQNGESVDWNWSFKIELPGQQQPLAARINGISVQNGLYVVDFGTSGFTPQLPGQHVHFFFNTVPPEQAGVPGSGPWILYGGPSPFTGYGVADRPGGATQMCILVANPDHSVQLGTGNCVGLP